MNIFSVLDTSDAEDEVVQKVNKKKETTNEKQAVATKPASSNKPQSAKPRDTKNDEVKASTGADDTRERKDDNRGGRPRGKEGVRRGDKHHGATEGEKARRPKREFERRSGTGRGKEVSRGGRGPYGFGNVEQEAHDAEKDPSKAELTAADNAEDVAEPEGESTPVEPEVEEVPTLSFDDFMRMREESRSNSSVLTAARAPRQVNLESQFAGLTTKEDKEYEQADQKASKVSNSKKDQRSTNKTQLLDVQFKFEANNYQQRQGGRRERENFTNKGGRFGGRTRKPRDAPAPLNSGDFPSL